MVLSLDPSRGSLKRNNLLGGFTSRRFLADENSRIVQELEQNLNEPRQSLLELRHERGIPVLGATEQGM